MKRLCYAKLVTVLSGAIVAVNGWAGLLYEPGNYAAQDNCVVNFDGISNAGFLKAHDGMAGKAEPVYC